MLVTGDVNGYQIASVPGAAPFLFAAFALALVRRVAGAQVRAARRVVAALLLRAGRVGRARVAHQRLLPHAPPRGAAGLPRRARGARARVADREKGQGARRLHRADARAGRGLPLAVRALRRLAVAATHVRRRLSLRSCCRRRSPLRRAKCIWPTRPRCPATCRRSGTARRGASRPDVRAAAHGRGRPRGRRRHHDGGRAPALPRAGRERALHGLRHRRGAAPTGAARGRGLPRRAARRRSPRARVGEGAR